jgi:hypothetical protein
MENGRSISPPKKKRRKVIIIGLISFAISLLTGSNVVKTTDVRIMYNMPFFKIISPS